LHKKNSSKNKKFKTQKKNTFLKNTVKLLHLSSKFIEKKKNVYSHFCQ
jgi:hypothetical protein